MERIFKNLVMKLSSLTKIRIPKDLKNLVAGDKTSLEVLENIKRLFIGLVWSTLLFPMVGHVEICLTIDEDVQPKGRRSTTL